MRKLYSILALCCTCSLANAQYLTYSRYVFLNQGGMKPQAKSIDNQYEDIKGEAFNSPQWLSARIVSTNGKAYDGFKCKLDIYTNTLYTNVNDTIYDLTPAPVKRVQLYPNFPDTVTRKVYQKGFVASDLKPESFLQVLVEGKVTFLKQETLEIKDVHEDALTTTKKFVGQDYYYIIKNGSIAEKVRLNKSTLQQVTGDKWKEVGAFMKAKELSASSADDWKMMIAYYNTL
ncbi:MAG: hypothetical protein JST68_14250 [Bacteroidetes bacterium]|nr:hypothetical protein [Bacteroidota bacterium]